MKKYIVETLMLIAVLFIAGGQTVAEPLSNDSTLFIIPSGENPHPDAKVSTEDELGHFTWGADLGSSVDLTANDMTSVDIYGYFGYKGGWMRFAGVGAGISSMLSNASRCYPVYAMVRTSFSSQPQLCFLDLRLGVSFNNMLTYPSQTDFFGSIGLGVTLARGKKFSSHMIVSYTFMPLRPYRVTTMVDAPPAGGESFEGDAPAPTQIPVTIEERMPNLHFASIRIGCSF